MHFQTKKAAREAGWKTEAEWMRRDYKTGRRQMIPKRDATPIIVKGEEFYSIHDCEKLCCITLARRSGLVPTDDAEPEMYAYSYSHEACFHYPLYRESDFRPVRTVRKIPPVEIDLLLAIFTVNKSAKRYRDAARKAYEAWVFGFATAHRKKKESLYELKDKGISVAFRDGRLRFIGRQGSFAVYAGGGYCFHSLLVPEGQCSEPGDTSDIFIESAPKSSSEARLKDAVFTLSQLPKVHESFTRLEVRSGVTTSQ